MYEMLFECFEMYKLTDGKAHTNIPNLSNSEIRKALDSFNGVIFSEKVDLDISSSMFNFIANTDLSGGIEHCSSSKCRMEKVKQMANFASLYADVVLIQNPFEKYETVNTFDEQTRYSIAADISIVQYLQPLIKRGIVRFAVSEHHFCKDCFQKVSSSKYYDYEEKANCVNNFIETEFIKDLSVTYENNKSYGFLKIMGPEYLVDHGVQYIHFARFTPNELMKYKGKRGEQRLSIDTISKLGIYNRMSQTIASDFAYQDWYTRNFDYSYLTNRSMDTVIVDQVNHINGLNSNRRIFEALAHELPIVENAFIEDVLRIREHEQESFLLYQANLKNLVRNLPENPAEVEEAFRDTVRPELIKLDINVKESRRSIGKNLTRNISVAGGIIGIGVISGLLPIDITQLIPAAGVCGVTQTAINSLTDSIVKPNSLRENPYYFLYKVKRTV